MDVFTLLMDEHKKAKAAMEKIIAGKTESKEALIAVCNDLMNHMEREEAILYPALEKDKETKDMMPEAYEEHQGAKDIVEQLLKSKNLTKSVIEKVEKLLGEIEHHVEEEEHEIFPKAKSSLTDAQIKKLSDQMTKMKKEETKTGQSVQ